MRRVLLAAVAALVFVPGAQGWTWPSDGSVLRPFLLGNDPYVGGQHRGVDVGGELGADVRAPASGAITFAGTVPGGGRAITILTADGYAVTLLQLGEILVARGQLVEEGAVVARVGPSGDAVTAEAHVHLGVRVASEPDGYLDPLTLLPPREPSVDEPEPVEAPAVVEEAPASEQPAAPPDVTEPEPPIPEASISAEPAAQPVLGPRADAVDLRPSSLPDESARREVRPVEVAMPAVAVPAVAEPVPDEGETARAAPRARPARAARPAARPAREQAAPRARQHTAKGEHEPALRPPATRAAEPRTRVSPAFALAVALAAGVVAAASLAQRRARPMMVADVQRAEDPRRSGLAVCERPEAHRPRGGVRRPVRHLRALPPAEGGRRPHGQRDGRARDAGDGRGRGGGALAA